MTNHHVSLMQTVNVASVSAVEIVAKDFNAFSDEELAVRYMQGDNKAFDMLLERSQTRLFSYILFIVRNHEVAEDIFQDTFVKAIVKLQQQEYAPKGKISAWLMRIAHNVIMDRFRNSKEKNSVDLLEDKKLEDMDSDTFSIEPIETLFINQQTLLEVKSLMDLLPATQREVVYMRFFQNLPFKEIAEITGVSINTSLGRMHYALQNLRKLIRKKNLNLNLV